MLMFLLTASTGLLNAYAQTPTQRVKGRVLDAESGQPVVGAYVVISSVSPVIGSAADANGYFSMANVPVGRHSIRCSGVGYEDAILQEIAVGAGKEVELLLKLTEALHTLDEVVIKAQKENGEALNDMVSVSARSFSVDQAKRYAAAVNDPARMALSFAGVSTNDDGNNQIIIRGNSPKGLLWRMEGVEIPNPNHFAVEGSGGGAISALSVNVLGNSDFLTGAFPAEYGNATSGVFDLKLRKGNSEKREYAFQAGVLGLDFAAEGPIQRAKGSSYLVNYRYSTLSILRTAGLRIAGDAATNFQDGAFKIFLPQKKQAVLSIWGMGGLSSQKVVESTFTENYKSDRAVAGVNYLRNLSSRSFIETIVSYSATRQTDDFQNSETLTRNEENFTNQAIRLTVNYQHKLNARHTIRTGLIASQLYFNLQDKEEEKDSSRILINQRGNTQLMQGFAQWKYRVTPTLTLNTGLHALGLLLNNQASIEPRIGMRWALAPKHTLSLGAGLHSRTEAISTYLALVNTSTGDYAPVNKDLRLSRSKHLVAGYEFRPAASWRLQTEAYLQKHDRVPIGPPTTLRPDLLAGSLLNEMGGYSTDSLASEGTGKSQGVELTVEKFLTNGFYLLSTTSLFESTYTARDGVERNTRFNAKYVQNILAGKEWNVGRTKTNVFACNIKGVWAGGNRVVPIDIAQSKVAGKAVYDWNRSFEEQLPDYFRTDVRVSFTKNGAHTTSTLSLDLQNVTNRLNAFSQYYNPTTAEVQIITQTGLIPVLNYRLEF
ncbi:TonB-dependent receptor [Arundinibacter roseus]|uniref:TonB-dependent receptor n=1 Tax=Arundinibacter roseus TaxID=2070510 RepID=A0A4R4KHH7_9BACT|nr:TonB-dependent receptor [Arundinibacter roseus]